MGISHIFLINSINIKKIYLYWVWVWNSWHVNYSIINQRIFFANYIYLHIPWWFMGFNLMIHTIILVPSHCNGLKWNKVEAMRSLRMWEDGTNLGEHTRRNNKGWWRSNKLGCSRLCVIPRNLKRNTWNIRQKWANFGV